MRLNCGVDIDFMIDCMIALFDVKIKVIGFLFNHIFSFPRNEKFALYMETIDFTETEL